jgi:hypothetical protein
MSLFYFDDVKAIPFTPKPIIFCPSEGIQIYNNCFDENFEPILECIKFQDCIQCPINGICDGQGIIKCNEGYI